ncbi:hypothetical protein Hanom_Chr16g01486451 [Helianthus anomalus]
MTRLEKFIRYPYLSHTFLAHVLTYEEFDPIFARKVLSEAYSFKADVTHTYYQNLMVSSCTLFTRNHIEY